MNGAEVSLPAVREKRRDKETEHWHRQGQVCLGLWSNTSPQYRVVWTPRKSHSFSLPYSFGWYAPHTVPVSAMSPLGFTVTHALQFPGHFM